MIKGRLEKELKEVCLLEQTFVKDSDFTIKKLVAEVTETKLPEGTWEKPPLERGDIIDKAMGNNLGHNFPTIDKVENGVVTSVKSRDLGAKTYQNGQGH